VNYKESAPEDYVFHGSLAESTPENLRCVNGHCQSVVAKDHPEAASFFNEKAPENVAKKLHCMYSSRMEEYKCKYYDEEAPEAEHAPENYYSHYRYHGEGAPEQEHAPEDYYYHYRYHGEGAPEQEHAPENWNEAAPENYYTHRWHGEEAPEEEEVEGAPENLHKVKYLKKVCSRYYSYISHTWKYSCSRQWRYKWVF
jgi:hypothetical protein